MSLSILKSIYNILLLILLPFIGISQVVDTVRVKPDWKPSRLHVGVDVSRLIGTAIKTHKNSVGGMIDLDFHRFLFAVESGVEEISRIKTYKYTNQGTFLKWGIDYNLIPHNKYRNMISLGLRHAQSRFSDELKFKEENDWLGTQDLQFSNKNVKSNWTEILLRLNVRVWKTLLLGSVLRIKMMKNVYTPNQFISFDIPGWGRNWKSGTNEKTANMGFSYYLIYNFSYREKKIPTRKIK
tara:strand:- start:1093 stop:1809 length:717 start_codon:yes stop_codon:yes gene_type:complete